MIARPVTCLAALASWQAGRRVRAMSFPILRRPCGQVRTGSRRSFAPFLDKGVILLLVDQAGFAAAIARRLALPTQCLRARRQTALVSFVKGTEG